MKYLLIFGALACSAFIPFQEETISGKYKIEYEQDYSSLDGTITFDGTTFKRWQLDGRKVKGEIDYQQAFVLLNEKKSHLQMIFAKRAIKNDTIYFRTKDLRDKTHEDELTIFAGKLIRIK